MFLVEFVASFSGHVTCLSFLVFSHRKQEILEESEASFVDQKEEERTTSDNQKREAAKVISKAKDME